MGMSTALVGAACEGQLEVVKYLIEEGGADIDQQRDDAVMAAVYAGRLEVVKYFAQEGVHTRPTTRDTETPLMKAAFMGRFQVAKCLLEDCGVNVNAVTEGGYTALAWAACRGHFEMVKYLVERGANTHATNRDGQTALMMAATQGHQSVVNYLQRYVIPPHNP